MAFAKGNKAAEGNSNSGRPGRDVIALGKELIEWSLLPDSLNLNGFCGPRRIPPTVIQDYAKKNDVFSECLQIAKACLAQNREKGVTTGLLHQVAYNKCAYLYDLFLKTDMREQLEFEAELNSKDLAQVSPDQENLFNAILNQISSRQSDRKKASKSSIKETKS